MSKRVVEHEKCSDLEGEVTKRIGRKLSDVKTVVDVLANEFVGFESKSGD